MYITLVVSGVSEESWFTLYGDVSYKLDDWLTVHRSITLVDFHLDAQNSYLFTYNTFINPLNPELNPI